MDANVRIASTPAAAGGRGELKPSPLFMHSLAHAQREH